MAIQAPSPHSTIDILRGMQSQIRSVQPRFENVSAQEKNAYDLFIKYTNADQVQGYAKGWNLDKLTKLAWESIIVIRRANPFNPISANPERIPQYIAIQWEFNQISELKRRLARAIECKKDYYEHHWLGKITKYILQCFGRWYRDHHGITESIMRAEDFLLRYNTIRPVLKHPTYKGCYWRAGGYFYFSDRIDAKWVRTHLDTSDFFDYMPKRVLPIIYEQYPIFPGNPPAYPLHYPDMVIRG